MPDGVTLPMLRHEPGPGISIEVGPLTLQSGEKLVLFGPNGAGKTTALRLMAGTLGSQGSLPSSAYMPQRPYMFRGTARHNLLLGLDRTDAERAEHLAARFGLTAKLEDQAAGLSGGERQRLGLARTLARTARLALLDEPLSAIDVADRDRVASIIAEALAGTPAVIVTHDRDVVAALADRAAVMIDGVVRQTGTVDEVFTLPASDDVAAAVGLGNVLSGVVVGTEEPLVEVDVDGVRIWGFGTQEPGTPVKVLFGAETVTVNTSQVPFTSARNVWSGEVAAVRRVGRLIELIVDVGPRVVALITPGSLEALDISAGRRVELSLKATAVHAVASPREQ